MIKELRDLVLELPNFISEFLGLLYVMPFRLPLSVQYLQQMKMFLLQLLFLLVYLAKTGHETKTAGPYQALL
jgi:hypothetical protein